MSIAAGQVIGNYRVLQQIGTGGMGAVFLAEHPQIGKKVALKVIHRELAHNREVVGRFFNEARSVNRIGNEHIVEVHDFGQSPDGHNYFIMEYLEGRTLAQVLSAERYLSVQRALHVTAQIADALGAAHAAGIIHRDLKPDNIMLVMRLGDPDFVKILDFGLAKMFADGMKSNLTAQGVVLGTPQYMSPEACESKRDVDHRTDIYAVGILLFQMLCGQLPFDGESMGEVLIKQVMHAPPAPRGINPHVPPSVEQIILRCLAKAPDSRFPTMLALRDALLDPDRYLASSPPVVPAALAAAAPGARTLFVDNGPSPQHAAQPLGFAQTQQVPAITGPAAVGRSTGPAMALRAPPPSMVTDARTMFDPGAGMPQPVAARAPSAMMGAQATIMADGGIDPAAIAASRRSTVSPGMQQPVVAENRTMVIGTPAGYKDRPPRKMWPIVVALVLVAALGGVAVALIAGGGGSKDGTAPVAAASDDDGSASASAVPAAGSASGSETAGGSGSGSVAGSGSGGVAGSGSGSGTGSASAVITPIPPDAGTGTGTGLVKIRIESDPSEAEVWIDGKQHGKTPTDVELEPADHELILRHPTRKEKKKTIHVTEATTIRLELERAGAVQTVPGSHKGSSRGSSKGTRKGSSKGSSTREEEEDTMKPSWMK